VRDLRSRLAGILQAWPPDVGAADHADCDPVQASREERVLDTIREKTKMIHRARRIRGQVEAIERALEQETSCSDMLRLIASTRGAINGLMAEVLEDYIRTYVVNPLQELDATDAAAAEELIEVVQCYLK
jgi:FrmR/RcnR family transcriptional regulator, repressor of frmRAB operon